MAERTIDRRIARTRATLQHALISLIPKKGYEAITVEDICDVANVGRSTFYAHCTGKDDLKRRGLDEHLRALLSARQKEALAAQGDGRARSLAFSLLLFEHARDHLELYRALAGGRGGEVSLGSIREILSDLVRAELAVTAAKNLPGAAPREFVVQYVVGAYMAVLTWWLDRGAKPPPAEVDRMFRRLATDGILAHLVEGS
ncbi:TetR/AcrR family transcriptional regulator [Mesorhizobium sp. 65-26]|jgi:AcrR family transcriptional regulator|uniref:TetR/AcrR family transcriptional regulator n=1 Tax=Mesorhizobium sp. 65-26 TaxID=1895781 RepID=UPI000A9C4285|nr:TetR/AcrR family transcriptional regulator [Mesorhizobium sp. 65-26]MBN9270895.1 TetR/AcrR family transcriptional regulator C-terminal domain-containing protein [Mesorhizobium sp.]